MDVGSLTGYAYLLRYDERSLARLSRDTFGAEFKGSRPTVDIRLLYEVEWATQSGAGENPGRLSADYLHLMAGVGSRRLHPARRVGAHRRKRA